MIPHSRPVFGQSFTDRVVRVIESGYVAMGSEARLLEQEVARRIQKECAVAVDSGTSAIMLVLRALSRKKKKVATEPEYLPTPVVRFSMPSWLLKHGHAL